MHAATSTVSPAHGMSFVDEDALLCPGLPRPRVGRTATSGHGLKPLSDSEFCHRTCEPSEAGR